MKNDRAKISTFAPKRVCGLRPVTGVLGLVFSITMGQSATAASLSTAAPGLTGVSPFGGAMAQEPESRSGKREGDLRVFEDDIRPRITRKLIDLAQRSDRAENPRWRLSLVRALARHERELKERDDLRLEIVRALVSLFAASEGSPQGALQGPGNPGAERHLVRGTAAMALARSHHPLALKKLLAVALSRDQTDPIGAALSLEALSSVPPDVLQTEDLSRLFTQKEIERVLGVDHERSSLDLHKLNLKEIVGWGSESQATVRPRPPPDYIAALRGIREMAHLPRQLARVSEWEQAFEENPVWTLRTWAYLGELLDQPVMAWGKKKSLELAESKSDLERSAGAWSLSVAFPDAVPRLLKKKDRIVTFAILSQASEGPVAKLVFSELQRGRFEKKDTALAWNLILQAKTIWPSLSTARLRNLEEDYRPTVFAALSSRVRTTRRGLGPDTMAVRGWLDDKSPEVRSSAAIGLGDAKTPAAQGLLYRAYRDETDPRVRRAIVSSIVQTSLGKLRAFTQLLAIDPDTTCRELAAAASESRRRGIFVGNSARAVAKVHDQEGRILEVPPAPDGFIGIVRSSF